MNSSALRCVVCGFVFALCASGCTNADPPVAPPPHKPKAERLLGRWKVVQIGDWKIPKDWELIQEYRPDGSYFHYTKDGEQARSHDGTYKVTGDKLNYHTFFDEDGKESKSESVLLSVSDTEAVISAPSGNQKFILRLERLPVR